MKSIASLAILCMHEAEIKAISRYKPTNHEDDQRRDDHENHNNVIVSCIAHSRTTRAALKSSSFSFSFVLLTVFNTGVRSREGVDLFS